MTAEQKSFIEAGARKDNLSVSAFVLRAAIGAAKSVASRPAAKAKADQEAVEYFMILNRVGHEQLMDLSDSDIDRMCRNAKARAKAVKDFIRSGALREIGEGKK